MGERAVTRQHLLDLTCEVLLAHEMPRFDLQRGRLYISGILAGGYRVVTTIRGATFRFTAMLYKAETTYLVMCRHYADAGNLNRLYEEEVPILQAVGFDTSSWRVRGS